MSTPKWPGSPQAKEHVHTEVQAGSWKAAVRSTRSVLGKFKKIESLATPRLIPMSRPRIRGNDGHSGWKSTSQRIDIKIQPEWRSNGPPSHLKPLSSWVNSNHAFPQVPHCATSILLVRKDSKSSVLCKTTVPNACFTCLTLIHDHVDIAFVSQLRTLTLGSE